MADIKLTKFDKLPDDMAMSLIQQGINIDKYDVYVMKDAGESDKKTLIISLGISPDDIGIIIE